MSYKGIPQASPIQDENESTLIRKYRSAFEQLKQIHGQAIPNEKLADIALELVRIDHDYVV